MTGRIKKIVSDKGFGFITGDNKKDYFFHRSDLDGEVFEHLNPKQKVSFEEYMKDGKDRARKVSCV
jgi:CspA family cold shock protein